MFVEYHCFDVKLSINLRYILKSNFRFAFHVSTQIKFQINLMGNFVFKQKYIWTKDLEFAFVKCRKLHAF